MSPESVSYTHLDVYKRQVQDGHTIAMASYSNSYSKIYESTEAFTDDLTQISDYITNLTGIAPDIYRFPGGSMNQISNVDMVELVKILNSKHITYFDWNVNSGDTADNCSVDDIVNNVTSGIAKYDNSVVLLHDDSNRSTTAEAVSYTHLQKDFWIMNLLLWMRKEQSHMFFQIFLTESNS